MDLNVLVNRCRKGDPLAWEALVKRFQKRIFSLAYYYVRDREEARDLAQEIFVKMYRGLSSFKNQDAFTGWMLTIGRRCCLDWIRRKQARIKTTTSEWDEPADEDINPEERWAQSERNRTLYRAIDTLSPHSRELILLKEIQGLKLAEISKMLSLPVGTVKSRSNRARIELAHAVTAIDPSFGGAG